MLTAKQKLWLIYKRLRTAFGVTLGFVVIYAAYTKNFDVRLLPIALGFWCIHLFGDLYNDYVDCRQDKRNGRKDKWINAGLVSRRSIKILCFAVLVAGMFALVFTNGYVLALGLLYAGTLTLYSNPRINMRRFDFLSYIVVGVPVLLFPVTFNTYFARMTSSTDIIFSIFMFSNYVYLYCQKDSTDLKDKTNLFIKRGWKTASLVCIFFASIAAVSFFELSVISVSLIFVWMLNVAVKAMNLYKISVNDISRIMRSRIILLEFINPYIFIAGVFLGS